MNNLGDCYCEGKGITQDYKKAIYWYEKATNLNNSDAMNSLGTCYYTGKGVQQDYKKAFEWFEKAAIQGNAIHGF